MTEDVLPVPPEPSEPPDTSAMTAEEYQAQKADLEQQLAALEAAWRLADVNIVPYPAWRYHATQGARLVNSVEEAEALGEDWSATPIPPTPAE